MGQLRLLMKNYSISKLYKERVQLFRIEFTLWKKYVPLYFEVICKQNFNIFFCYVRNFDDKNYFFICRFLNFRISVSSLDRCSTDAEAQSAHQVWMHQSYCSLLGFFFSERVHGSRLQMGLCLSKSFAATLYWFPKCLW